MVPRGRAIISKALLNAGLFVWLNAYLVWYKDTFL